MESGTRLGPYEIREQIGAGGMGEVYSATDTRLDRAVAIKVLPEHLADDPQRRERFEREAKAVSSLNHPHICTLHDVGEQDGTHYLVMELVEGDTLAARLEKGRLPLDQALEYAIQIADALDKAHRQGIVHRDLKPGNIMLTKSGVKLLDFGLAKLKGDAGPASTFSQMATADASKPLTAEGSIIGTLQYMAPEQLEGKDADARTDIFAFGSVAYEMVTGKQAFEGKSQASLIGAIMNSELKPMAELDAMTPAELDYVVHTCLEKDPDDRWQSARDMLRGLDRIARGEPVAAAEFSNRTPWSARTVLVAGLAGLLIGAAAVGLIRLGTAPDAQSEPVRRLSLRLPAGDGGPGTPLFTELDRFGLDPGGRFFVLNALEASVLRPQLFVYQFDTGELLPIPGTQGVQGAPAVSASGTWVAFRTGPSLQRVSLSGGTVQLTSLPEESLGLAWDGDENVLFGGPEGISIVPSGGGPVRLITAVDADLGELDHRWPYVTPDGTTLAYTAWLGAGNAYVRLRSLVTNEEQTLMSGSSPRVTPTGHLVFIQEGCTLVAVPIDRETLELRGQAMPVLVDGVKCGINGGAWFDITADGMIVFPQRVERTAPLELIGRNGSALSFVGGGFQGVNHPPYRISPAGRRLAETRHPTGDGDQIVIHDLEEGTVDTLNWAGESRAPVWNAHGSALTFTSITNGTDDLFEVAATPGAQPEELLVLEGSQRPTSWSPDDQVLAYTDGVPPTSDIWLYYRDGRAPSPLVDNPAAAETGAAFSPNGRYVAYVSNERGPFDVYVQSYPDARERIRVSVDGGMNAVWNPQSDGLYYQSLEGDGIYYASITASESGILERGTPELVLGLDLASDSEFGQGGFDVRDGGQSFVVMRQDPAMVPGLFRVVSNWFEELERLAPTGN